MLLRKLTSSSAGVLASHRLPLTVHLGVEKCFSHWVKLGLDVDEVEASLNDVSMLFKFVVGSNVTEHKVTGGVINQDLSGGLGSCWVR